MTEKRQTSQDYIIRILQHFATKLRNITNFVMLFQAEMKFLSRLVYIKILVIRGKVNCCKETGRQTTRAHSEVGFSVVSGDFSALSTIFSPHH